MFFVKVVELFVAEGLQVVSTVCGLQLSEVLVDLAVVELELGVQDGVLVCDLVEFALGNEQVESADVASLADLLEFFVHEVLEVVDECVFFSLFSEDPVKEELVSEGIAWQCEHTFLIYFFAGLCADEFLDHQDVSFSVVIAYIIIVEGDHGLHVLHISDDVVGGEGRAADGDEEFASIVAFLDDLDGVDDLAFGEREHAVEAGSAAGEEGNSGAEVDSHVGEVGVEVGGSGEGSHTLESAGVEHLALEDVSFEGCMVGELVNGLLLLDLGDEVGVGLG